MKRWALIPMLGNQNPSRVVGEQQQSTHTQRPMAVPTNMGPMLEKVMGLWYRSVVGWGPPWENQFTLLSETPDGQSAVHPASESGKMLSLTKERRTEGSFQLKPVGKGGLFSSQRGQGWPELLETPIWPSWNYLACLFCCRGGRVVVVLFRGISCVLTQARGTGSWENPYFKGQHESFLLPSIITAEPVTLLKK